MVKLLIVDDEYIVREGLKSTIDWAKIGVEIVGEASSGSEGLTKANALAPDIIISDVKMPAMDGLEFTAALHKSGFDGEIIMLSGYSDFDFARRSIELGVFAYLLKPMENEELVAKVKDAVASLEKKRAEKRIVKSFFDGANVLKSKVIDDSVNGRLTEEDARERLKPFNIEPITAGIVIFGKLNEGFKLQGGEMNALYRIICESLSGRFNFFGDVNGSCFTLILGGAGMTPEGVRDAAYNALRRYEKEYSATVSIGISAAFDGFSALPAAYDTAVMLQSNTLFHALNTVAMGGDFVPYKKVVADVIDIISRDYMKNISVGTTAAALYVSESHLMHVFKDNLGKTFNECLTEFRVLKAKELLLKGRYRVGEIAELVGYSDVKYFGQVFKKHTGMTPSEFVYAESLRY